jgi:hypothetical protein
MDILENINFKRTFLYLLVASISLSALIGFWAILSGDFGEFQARVLGTTLTIVGTSVLGLSCGAYLESPRSKNTPLSAFPLIGIILAILAALTAVYLIWFDTRGYPQTEAMFKFFGVTTIFAFSLAHLSLLSLARLVKKFQWAMTVAYVSILALASILSIILIFEPHSEDFFVLRGIGILAVTDAAITVMIPVFHRLSRADFIDEKEISAEKIDVEIAQLKRKIAELELQKQKVPNQDL